MLLSLLMITKNSGELLGGSLASARGLYDEAVIVDDFSSDNTQRIAKEFGATLYKRRCDDLGSQRAFGLEKCKGEWVFMLDADEQISSDLKTQILKLQLKSQSCAGFYIPYQNHFLGRPIYYGGEDYKILRLFRKEKASISDNLVHEHVKVEGKMGYLEGKICHYSYRTLPQTYAKFTNYAKREALRKLSKGEKTSLGKLITYPIHMFWARFIKDKGYKDYLLRILLDLGFGYMEFLTYFLMFFYRHIHKES